MKRWSLCVAVLSLQTLGCFTIGSSQTASTLGKGRLSGGVEGSVNLVAIPNAATAAAYKQPQLTPYPAVNGFFRFGVSDQIDLGVRGGGTLIELQSKFMFTAPESQFVLSVAPSLSGYYLPSTSTTDSAGRSVTTPNQGSLYLPVPVLVGYKLGNHELVFSGRLVNQLALVRDAPAGSPLLTGFIFSLGATAGIALRLGEAFIMMPEIALQAPVFATVSTPFGQASSSSLGIIQATGGISFMFGKFKPRSGVPVEPSEPPPAPPPTYVPPPQELPPDVAPPPPPPPPPAN